MLKLSHGIILILIAFLFTACDVQKKTDEMVKTSNDINDRSKHLAKRTDDLEPLGESTHDFAAREDQ